jgi:hypothetical protein
MKNKKELALRELRKIPGVGKIISQNFWDINLRSVKDLKNKDPEKLYKKLCRFEGEELDRCVLYVFRCAVYFASIKNHDKELLKWWNWKDKVLHLRGSNELV